MARANALLCTASLLLVYAAGCKPPAAQPAGNGTSTQTDNKPTVAIDKPATSSKDFAKDTFTRLANGDTSVADNIGWETLRANGMDVGAMYNKFDEPNRAAFRTSFITSFAKSFKASGASAGSLTDWKLDKEDSSTATVSTSGKNHARLLITVSKGSGSQRMIGMEPAK